MPRRKKCEIFPCEAFLLCVADLLFIDAPLFREPFLPWRNYGCAPGSRLGDLNKDLQKRNKRIRWYRACNTLKVKLSVLKCKATNFIWFHWLFMTYLPFFAEIAMTDVQKCHGGFSRNAFCSKLTIKTPEQRYWRHSGIFIVNFEHITHLFLAFLLLTLNT